MCIFFRRICSRATTLPVDILINYQLAAADFLLKYQLAAADFMIKYQLAAADFMVKYQLVLIITIA